MNKSKILCRMENLINMGKTIIIYDCLDKDLLESLCADIKDRNMNEIQIWHSFKENNTYNFLGWITREEMEEILNIYRTYDFSDKILVVSESNQYGCLFNYLQTGILTKQEMVVALLYKIS